MESYRKKVFSDNKSAVQQLESLLEHDAVTDEIVEKPWHGAEAFHYLIVCQRQLAVNDYESAFRTVSQSTSVTNIEDTMG